MAPSKPKEGELLMAAKKGDIQRLPRFPCISWIKYRLKIMQSRRRRIYKKETHMHSFIFACPRVSSFVRVRSCSELQGKIWSIQRSMANFSRYRAVQKHPRTLISALRSILGRRQVRFRYRICSKFATPESIQSNPNFRYLGSLEVH